jgi:hypothetical protein
LNKWLIDGQWKIETTASDIFTWLKIEDAQNKGHHAECEELGIQYDIEHKTWIKKSKF